MPSGRVLRPRTLSVGFGLYFLVMAIIAWYSGSTLGYHYSTDITRWSFTVYLVVGAIFLVGIGLGAIRTMRYLDARMDALESSADQTVEVVEEVVVEEPASDEVPPPLAEETAPAGDHVDRDIDELLVSLQEMEQDAESTAAPPAEESAEAPSGAAPGEKRVSALLDSKKLSALRTKRDHITSYFAGPALASLGAIGISASMLVGSDEFLQLHWDWNTALLLGLGYTFVGIAAYVVASMLLVTRNR